jgi:aspartyl-tRNA(Asn)/glutamyl-tRNA(Gln) amidotransferase subunit C
MSNKTIDHDLVRHIGKLSRIALNDEEVARFADQLGDVLGAFDKLQQLDTETVQPMAHAVELKNVLADDQPREGLSSEQALANAPQRQGDYYKVPRVLGESS